MERLGGLHRILADHGIDDQQDVVGPDFGFDPVELLHEHFVERAVPRGR